MTSLIDKHSGKNKKYCSKGDKLTLISVHVDVLIVECKGERFSIKINETDYEDNAVEQSNEGINKL